MTKPRGKPFEEGNQHAKKKDIVNILFSNIQRHTIPEFSEIRGKDWMGYGKDNLYPQYLLKLSQRSAKHNAILTGKQHFISGNGWVVDGEENAELQAFIDNANKNETLDDILEKVALDLEIFGGFALEIIWNKLKTKIASISHMDFSYLRSSKKNSLFYFTRHWNDKGRDNDNLIATLNPQDNKDFERILAFNPRSRIGKQILYFKQYRSGLEVYPVPEYIGCVPYVEMDYEIANFHLNAIKNNFVGGYWINFRNGIPEKEKQREIERAINNKFSGTDRAGTSVINFSDPDKAPEFKPLQQNDMDKMFDILNKTVRQEIFTGHKVTSPNIFGVETEQPFGGRTEIREKTEIFQNSYVTPKQNIIERVFNRLAGINGLPMNLKIQPIETLTEQLSEQALLQILSQDELRERIGLEPVAQTSGTGIAAMSEKEQLRIVEMFKKRGEHRSAFVIHESRPYYYRETPNNENVLIEEVKFAKSLDRSVLDLLDKDSFMPVELIAKQLNASKNEVLTAISRLQSAGRLGSKIRISGDDRIKELKPTVKGLKVIKEEPARTADIEVRYSYEVEAGFGARAIDTTRPFCLNLLAMDKLYTRAEIEQISAREGRNVWETRGGWYRNPNTNETTPFCRHIWLQNIVTKK